MGRLRVLTAVFAYALFGTLVVFLCQASATQDNLSTLVRIVLVYGVVSVLALYILRRKTSW